LDDDAQKVGDDTTPNGATVPDGVYPADTCTSKGFGLSFTDAQRVETKLLKMLNDIQAP
jgi:hypothetical protein